MVALTCKLRELGERIVQYNLNTGKVIRDICLPQAVKFKYLAWAEPNEMFYVKSVHSVDRSRFHIRAGLSLHVAVVIAIFSAFPIRFIGMFEVDRRVFGAGITNAIITNSLLVVMYITGDVKFFSLENILQKYKLFDCDIEDCCTEPFCEHPCPLQMNIKITECPPVLLDVKCADQNVQIGGYPWHYISTPRGMMGLFEITSLDNHVMVEGGVLKAEFVHPDSDSCCFHGDGSGRIMFITKNIVKIYQLVHDEDNDTRSLQILTTINVKHDQQKPEIIQMTSSGRCIRRRQSVDVVSLDDSINIQQLEYEDELDLTWLSVSETGMPYHVCFYDNQTLQELRDINLEKSEVSDECYEQQICVDLDTIVLVTKPRLGQFICTVYRLSGDLHQVDQSTISKLKSSSKSKDNSLSNRRRGSRTRTR
ncbi:Ddb1 and cul4 associated factor 17 [Mactra antiquata]